MNATFSSGERASAPIPITVRPGGHSDVRPLSRLLVRSFRHDPQFTWIFGDLGAHENQFAAFFAVYLHDALRSGALDVAVDQERSRLVGAALWMAPGSPFPPLGRQVLTLPRYAAIFRTKFRAASTMAGELVRAHPKEPHWYLTVLGVEPDVQGCGVGGALLRSGLSRSDGEGRAAYLETNNEKNVALYTHFGFSVAAVVNFRSGCPASTTMWRSAATPVDSRGVGTA